MTIEFQLPVQTNTFSHSNIERGNSTTEAQQTNLDFNDTLQSTMLAQLMASLDSSSSNLLFDGTGNSAGAAASANIAMMFSLISLYEQIISQQVENASTNTNQEMTSLASLMKTVSGGVQASVQHINQFLAELQVGGNGANANCGPTSLVMALHQLGLRVAGETSDTSDGEAVDLARRSMAASSAKDGVDAYGNRVDAEHSTYTNFNDLARGAAAAGAKSQAIKASAEGIRTALQRGASVIASGTFAGKYPLPWTGDRGFDNNSAPGNATAHLIEISSYNSSTNTFTIHDPARSQATQVSAAALEKFMAGNAGAMAFWK